MLMVWVLGPMAVVPEYQRRGIGTKLIEAANRKIKDAGYPFIIVVGHAQYYPGFGSRPAIESGIKWEWDISGRSFHVLVLNEAKMQGASGLAKYRHEFSTIF
jgi:putative acetyltransferase